MGMRAAIEVHIERLVLHGFEHIDRDRFGKALTGELEHLLSSHTSPALLSRDRECELLDCGSFEVGKGAASEAIGTGVAQTVLGGFST
jgi:hypothetical protein